MNASLTMNNAMNNNDDDMDSSSKSKAEEKTTLVLPVYDILTRSGIIEIAGAKGSGKSCLLLHYAE